MTGTSRSSRRSEAVRSALLDAWAVLSPIECAGCGSPDRAVCRACRAALLTDPVVRSLEDGTPVLAAFEYSGTRRAMVLQYKGADRTDVARALAVPLADIVAMARELPGAATAELAPLPASFGAYRRRGYDPVRLLLRRARLPEARVLRRVRGGGVQKALGSGERRRNVAGMMLARRALPGRGFLLVDDVVTTGATLEEGARAIRAAGGHVVAAVALASVPLRVAERVAGSLEYPGTFPAVATRFIARR
jgi:ComF family protein